MQQLIKENFEALGCFDFGVANKFPSKIPKVNWFLFYFTL